MKQNLLQVKFGNLYKTKLNPWLIDYISKDCMLNLIERSFLHLPNITSLIVLTLDVFIHPNQFAQKDIEKANLKYYKVLYKNKLYILSKVHFEKEL